MTGELRDADTQRLLVPHVVAAESPVARTVGLIGRRSLNEGEALWFDRTSAIHTFFMAFPIDVLFLDAATVATGIAAAVPPWRPFVGVRGARSVLELAAGSCERLGIAKGMKLTLRWDPHISSS
ncbi:MAG: DUF192 domain-containing protein [Candidatus Eremiobacteraeota bacterium]|nr:DUF192 domain-containing protein [Candidatus Eremiobacteraeota bacterium]MBV8284272.1 DUF192 domain-containing protein [Candidatus Eremiobacteraeota bacterium]